MKLRVGFYLAAAGTFLLVCTLFDPSPHRMSLAVVGLYKHTSTIHKHHAQ